MAASCTFRTDYAFLWAQAVLFVGRICEKTNYGY